jgi:hypothetical protein
MSQRVNTPATGEINDIVEAKAMPMIRKIRIKMSMTPDTRSMTPQSLPTNDDDDGSTDTDDDDVTTNPTQDSQEQKDAWDDSEVREMVNSEENWRVVGLSNVGILVSVTLFCKYSRMMSYGLVNI